ncbi:MAG: SLC13 family permease [Desulfobacterales bacterium]
MTTSLGIFLAAYVGIALGHVPGLTLDRTGIALLGAMAMILVGAISLPEAVAAVDVPTLVLLYALMIVSAQLRLGGFYTQTALAVASVLVHPRFFLFASMLTSAVLSAVLANDIVCLAFTPVLAMALLSARRNPIPYLLGLALASNIGSAATLIGNPQNMLIGQVGRLAFDRFFLWCAPPAAAALLTAYLLLCFAFRREFHRRIEAPEAAHLLERLPRFDRWQSLKGLAVVVALLALFFTPVPREVSALGAAGVLLCSRKMSSRAVLQLVDWHLLTLFCALFILVHALELTGAPAALLAALRETGFNLHDLDLLAAVAVLLSNLVSNVPAVMLLVRFLDPAQPASWYTLAVASTFAGNLIPIGSIANLIVIEQAAAAGVTISFRDYVRVGVPVTLLSLVLLALWIRLGPG